MYLFYLQLKEVLIKVTMKLILFFHFVLYCRELPDWVQIYYVKNTETEYKCNLCEATVITDEKCMDLLKHISTSHNEIQELHKENPDGTIGFQIEFLQLNVMKDAETKSDEVILTDVCSPLKVKAAESDDKDDKMAEMHYVLVPKKKKLRRAFEITRKRSWVWKYFDKLSNIIYRCNLCNVVLSIKGCNTNNMNRHVRSRHPTIYKAELDKKREFSEIEIPQDDIEEVLVKNEDLIPDKDLDESESMRKQRRSWIWSYFKRVSDTLAQCKLCNRHICHGGNATGNMNRHLKMIHQKTGEDTSWVWKVFDNSEQGFFTCNICQFKCLKLTDMEKNICSILDHLRIEHGVISSEQIITGAEYDVVDN